MDDDDDDDDCSVCISCCTCSSASTTDVNWVCSDFNNFEVVIHDKKTKQIRNNMGYRYRNGICYNNSHVDLTINSPPPSPSSSVEFLRVTPPSVGSVIYDDCTGIDTNQDLDTCVYIKSIRDKKKIRTTMARSKKNNVSDSESDMGSDSDFSDLDYDEPLPPKTTTEDAFNNIFRGGTTLPTRTRKKPQPYGSTPTPPPPPPHTSQKKNSKKKTAPLVNSSRTNQSTNNNKTKMKKRPRVKAKASTKQSSSVAPLSSIATNVLPELLSTSVPNAASTASASTSTAGSSVLTTVGPSTTVAPSSPTTTTAPSVHTTTTATSVHTTTTAPSVHTTTSVPTAASASTSAAVVTPSKDPSQFVLDPVEAQEFHGATDDRSIPLGDYLRKMQTTVAIYGDDTDMIKGLTSNTNKHETAKLKIEARFFASLLSNDTLKHLSKYVKDPVSHIDTKIRQLYVYCRGLITRDNYEILNTCLVWFSKSFVKQAYIHADLTDKCTLVRAQYQPNTVAKSFRCLFAVFKSNQVMFSLAKDFLGKGGFCSWWKRNFGICEEIDTTYGHKPNEATWDVNFRQKRLACHEDPLHPFQVFDALMNVINYFNFMRVLIEEIKVCCCLRAAKEPAYIVRDNWEFFTITEGHFKGTPACRLKSDHSGQKNKALTINNHTAIDNLKNVQHLPILKTNKKFDTYTMIKRQLYEFLPPDEHIHGPARIFRKEASAKQLKDWKAEMGEGCTWRANPNASMVIGENQYSPICVSLATDLGYTNPKTNTGQGNRKAGISLIGNSGCGPTTMLGASRHSTLETSAKSYLESSMEDQLRASLAVQGTDASQIKNPPQLDKPRCSSVPIPLHQSCPFDTNTIHSPASFDGTIDSTTRPTSFARVDSLNGPIINRGRSKSADDMSYEELIQLAEQRKSVVAASAFAPIIKSSPPKQQLVHQLPHRSAPDVELSIDDQILLLQQQKQVDHHQRIESPLQLQQEAHRQPYQPPLQLQQEAHRQPYRAPVQRSYPSPEQQQYRRRSYQGPPDAEFSLEDRIESLYQHRDRMYPPPPPPPRQQYHRAPARDQDAIEDQIQSLRQQQREESYHRAPPRRQQYDHFDPYDAPPQQAVHRSSYRPPQQEPVYEHRTERVARMSYSPDQGRQVEYTVSHSNQVTQQPRQQFARLPRSGSEQQRLQYEEYPPRSAPHYRRR